MLSLTIRSRGFLRRNFTLSIALDMVCIAAFVLVRVIALLGI